MNHVHDPGVIVREVTEGLNVIRCIACENQIAWAIDVPGDSQLPHICKASDGHLVYRFGDYYVALNQMTFDVL